MTREEFIQESAMRNMQAFIAHGDFDTESRETLATDAIGLANAMSEYLFTPEYDE